jgi:hypothetical protein
MEIKSIAPDEGTGRAFAGHPLPLPGFDFFIYRTRSILFDIARMAPSGHKGENTFVLAKLPHLWL